jgi:hypothetical protein
MKIQVFAVDI